MTGKIQMSRKIRNKPRGRKRTYPKAICRAVKDVLGHDAVKLGIRGAAAVATRSQCINGIESDGLGCGRLHPYVRSSPGTELIAAAAASGTVPRILRSTAFEIVPQVCEIAADRTVRVVPSAIWQTTEKKVEARSVTREVYIHF